MDTLDSRLDTLATSVARMSGQLDLLVQELVVAPSGPAVARSSVSIRL